MSLLVTFDPSKNIDATTSGLTVNAFSLPLKTEFAYDKVDDILIFGTEPAPGACRTDADMWCAFIANASQAFPSVQNLFVSSANGGTWIPQHVTLNIGLAAPAPEPSTWVLMILCFGATGRLRRGRWARPLHAVHGS